METARKALGVFLVFVFALFSGDSTAQSYPNRPIKFVVAYPPGGANDILARVVAPKLSERLDQPVIVENKPGADGIIGTEFVAKSAPDGHTLLTGASGQMVFNTGLHAKLPYDPAKDFIPITMFYSEPLVFAVHPSVPANSIRELIALAKARPGEMFYASAAAPFYVATEHFKKLAGVNIVHVPYKGTAQAVIGTVAGETSLVVMTAGSLLSQLRAGKLRALAVTGTKRDPANPDIPAMAESGLDFEGVSWTGLFAPAGTPSAIIDKLYSELSVVLKSDSIKERYASLGYGTSVLGISPVDFETFFRAELVKWTQVIRDLNLRAN